MSTTGLPVSPTTREKISLSKTKFTKDYLIEKGTEYIDSVLSSPKDDPIVPTHAGLCLAIGCSRSRLWEITQTIPEVADIVEHVSLLQEQYALSGGLTNKTNASFSQFLLKSKHHYTDTPPVMTQNNNFNLTPEVLADALKLMEASKK